MNPQTNLLFFSMQLLLRVLKWLLETILLLQKRLQTMPLQLLILQTRLLETFCGGMDQ